MFTGGGHVHYDVIGDVHGYATRLTSLLDTLGYAPDDDGVYRHPDRHAVFVGDFIDGGDEQLDVLELVKAMADAGSAQVVMGNHEFNAISWATAHPDTGKPLREHSPKHAAHHSQFLTQLTAEQQAHYVAWFTTLPLWLDLGEIRVVHACWHEDSMKAVRAATGSNRLSTAGHYAEANREGSALYEAIEALLKGPEIPLSDYGMEPYWDQFAGRQRDRARVRWWDRDTTTLPALVDLRDATRVGGGAYPDYALRDVAAGHLSFVYRDTVPLFYGHYWREWEPVPRDHFTAHTACLDFSGGLHGVLCAYRWSGEPEILRENYVPHDRRIVAPTPSGHPA